MWNYSLLNAYCTFRCHLFQNMCCYRQNNIGFSVQSTQLSAAMLKNIFCSVCCGSWLITRAWQNTRWCCSWQKERNILFHAKRCKRVGSFWNRSAAPIARSSPQQNRLMTDLGFGAWGYDNVSACNASELRIAKQYNMCIICAHELARKAFVTCN